MDAYDAILEQLRRAQKRGLDAVTNRLDFVVESLDELIKEAKNSVHEAVPQDADELFPTAEVETAVAELRDRAREAEERADGLARRVVELEGRAPGKAAGGGVSLAFMRRLDEKKSQSELLRELLPVLLEHASRAVVLVIRGGAISAWSGIGFANAEGLRNWSAEAGASAVLDRFASDMKPVHFRPTDDPVFAAWLSGEAMPDEAILIPVVLRGKMMGGFYADRVGARPWDPDVAQAIVAMACWMIDTLHHRQATPTPMLAEAIELAAETPTPIEAAAEPEIETEFEAAAEPEFETEIDEEIDEGDTEEPEPAGKAYDPTATVRVESPAVEPAPTPPSRPEPPPVSPVVPPPPAPAKPPAGDAAQRTPEDQARHEEARRFARLLVSEIKLYNETEVEQGRANRNIYSRLKEDIDRSHEMFEKRIPPDVVDECDYFREELIRILADGDEGALGM